MAAGRLDVSRRRGGGGGGYFDEVKRGDDRGLVRKSGYHSSTTVPGFDFRRTGFSCRDEERQSGEPWQFNAFGSSKYEEGEIPPNEDGVQLPPDKKRKFSPVVWDEEKKVKISSKNRVVQSTTTWDLNVVSDKDALKSPVKGGLELVVDGVSADGIGSEYPAPLTPSLHPKKDGGPDQEQGQVEEEELPEARTVAMSRWASDDDSPRDTSLIDDKGMHGEMLCRNNLINREGFHREVSDRDGSSSSASDERGYSCSSASEYELQNDAMDIDDIRDENDSGNEVEQTDGEEPTATNQRGFNMLEGCRSVFEYERLNEINEGTYGKVYKARDKKTGEFVALKKVKMNVGRDKFLEEYGFPLTSLREINILMSFDHPSIVKVKEVVMGDLDSVFMVMEYMEHDLKGLMQSMKQPFSTSEVKCLMLQLLEGVKYLHDNWVLHRDLKTSNLLFNNQGELKVCDFGMSRQYGSALKPYTSLVVTLWYRAPELLLGAKKYSTAVDMWSVGCIMAEMLTKEPLFTGKGEIDQLDKIFKTLGTPNETIWPGLSKLPGAKANFVKQPYNQLRKKFPFTPFTGSPVLSDSGFDLLNRLLTFDPEKRITADDALNHPWFNEVPLSKSKEFMPTFPPQYAKNRPNQRTMKCLDSRSSEIPDVRQWMGALKFLFTCKLLKAFSIKCKKKSNYQVQEEKFGGISPAPLLPPYLPVHVSGS
ncbi:CELL DIVISION PROTEIN KINASE [Salix viminalis]|uniref:cyclin-dependent kinase n=1 Tax=Salix viminalis TaxID=40686 RepID=A0A9Q0NMB0_SALVM|nr:CELL DIVISION PROTEIN KINASE [Salix viminalis]